MKNKGFNESLSRLAHQIKELRLTTGLSQEALALAAGVDRTYVSQLERGVANPSIKILYRLSVILNSKLEISLKPDQELSSLKDFAPIRKKGSQ